MPRVSGDARNAILDEALLMFSEKGFEPTSMRDIAAAVGMRAPSLYNHFKGKQELFDALIERETTYIEEVLHASGAMALPGDDPSAYCSDEPNAVEDLVWRSYAPFFTDARIGSLRRMLATSRFKDERCNTLFRQIFIDRPIALQKAIFTRLVDTGSFAPCDAGLAAAEFHGPLFMLMDAAADPRDAETFCRGHTAAFNETHRKGSAS